MAPIIRTYKRKQTSSVDAMNSLFAKNMTIRKFDKTEKLVESNNSISRNESSFDKLLKQEVYNLCHYKSHVFYNSSDLSSDATKDSSESNLLDNSVPKKVGTPIAKRLRSKKCASHKSDKNAIKLPQLQMEESLIDNSLEIEYVSKKPKIHLISFGEQNIDAFVNSEPRIPKRGSIVANESHIKSFNEDSLHYNMVSTSTPCKMESNAEKHSISESFKKIEEWSHNPPDINLFSELPKQMTPIDSTNSIKSRVIKKHKKCNDWKLNSSVKVQLQQLRHKKIVIDGDSVLNQNRSKTSKGTKNDSPTCSHTETIEMCKWTNSSVCMNKRVLQVMLELCDLSAMRRTVSTDATMFESFEEKHQHKLISEYLMAIAKEESARGVKDFEQSLFDSGEFINCINFKRKQDGEGEMNSVLGQHSSLLSRSRLTEWNKLEASIHISGTKEILQSTRIGNETSLESVDKSKIEESCDSMRIHDIMCSVAEKDLSVQVIDEAYSFLSDNKSRLQQSVNLKQSTKANTSEDVTIISVASSQLETSNSIIALDNTKSLVNVSTQWEDDLSECKSRISSLHINSISGKSFDDLDLQTYLNLNRKLSNTRLSSLIICNSLADTSSSLKRFEDTNNSLISKTDKDSAILPEDEVYLSKESVTDSSKSEDEVSFLSPPSFKDLHSMSIINALCSTRTDDTTFERPAAFINPGKPWRRSVLQQRREAGGGRRSLARRSIFPLQNATPQGYVSEKTLQETRLLEKLFEESSIKSDDEKQGRLITKANNFLQQTALDVQTVGARELVLRRCGQTQPLLFSQCYPDTKLKHCHKIGEGVYGEVFLFRNSRDTTTVMKVMPIEGDQTVNGEKQKQFKDILTEIIIAMELSNLRLRSKNKTDNFNEVNAIRCVRGKYPERLLDLWDLYDENKNSENDSPSMFDDNQLYIVLELGNAGKDLECFIFRDAQQAYAIFEQTACALAAAEMALQFEHRDLHWGNLLIATEDKHSVEFNVSGRLVEVLTCGVRATIIDYSLSRITYEDVAIFSDLSNDLDLFTTEGDYQFEIYRQMQLCNSNKWHDFVPHTNILWLHYILDKMICGVHYQSKQSKQHKFYLKKMSNLKGRFLSYKNASDYVLENY